MSSIVNAAQEKVTKKDVVIEKVGRLWSVVEIVESVGDALSDVLHLRAIRLIHADPHIQIHPAIGAAMSALKLLKEVKM